MVEGPPLHYYYPYTIPVRRFASFQTMDEMILPPSPNSAQSDSDNSISSIEAPSRTPNTTTTQKNEIRCCWKSCGINFESLDQLANHVSRVHSSSGPGGLFYCGWEGCSRNNRGFNARYKMLVHVRTHTNEKPHQCCQCEKSFSRAENLKIHSRSHSGEKPYVCPVPGCNKAYSNSSDRFKHTRTHQVEKPYQCKVPGCPKRYTDPSSLRKHVKTYKHFVNENITNDQKLINENNKLNHQFDEKITEPMDNHTSCCNSLHKCCKLNKTTEFLRLGAFINFREEKCMPYLLDPFIPESERNIYVSYHQNNNMEVDVPLDLSINRKVI